MKIIALFGFFTVITCLQVYSKEGNEKAWSKVKKPIEKFKLEHKGKNILLFYKADWCLTCKHTEKLLITEDLKKILTQQKVLIAIVDCTDPKSIGAKNLKSRGAYRHVPALSLITEDGKIKHLDEDCCMHKKKLINTLNLALKKDTAEQVAAPDGQ